MAWYVDRMEDWWPDDIRFAGAEHLDAEFVAGYDTKARFDPASDVALLQRYGLDEDSTLIDLGAGTGTVSVAVAATGASVVAIDPSPAMVDAIVAKTRYLPNVTVHRAGMLSYEGDSSADFLYSRNALHQLPDFWKVMALVRIGSMLTHGGVLILRDLIYDVEPDDANGAINDWLRTSSIDPAAGYTARDIAAHVSSEFSTFSWLLEEAFERTGFEVLEKVVDRSIYARYVCRFPGA